MQIELYLILTFWLPIAHAGSHKHGSYAIHLVFLLALPSIPRYPLTFKMGIVSNLVLY